MIVFHGFSYLLFLLLAIAIVVYQLPFFGTKLIPYCISATDKNLFYFLSLKAKLQFFNYADNSVSDDFCISLNRG